MRKEHAAIQRKALERRKTLVTSVRHLLECGDTRTSRELADDLGYPYPYFLQVMRENGVKVFRGRVAEDLGLVRVRRTIDKSSHGTIRESASLPKCVLKAAGLLGATSLQCTATPGRIVVTLPPTQTPKGQ